MPANRPIALLLACVLAALVAACSAADPRPTPPRSAPLTIVCTTGMVADMVRAVAGDRAKVEAIMGAGVDPHLFRPTRSDVARLSAADAVFYNGLLLEGKMTETFERLAASGKPVVAVAGALAAEHLIPSDDDASEHGPSNDPHVWMDPALWSRGIDIVRDRLSAIDPAGAKAFAANAETYRTKLAELDAYAKQVLSSVPGRARVLITAHDAFGYFGRHYGYTVEGIQGISTESEAGVRDIQRLVELITDRAIKAVFVETSVSDRNVKALIDGVNARAGGKDSASHSVSIGGSLYSDALGPADTYEGTYIGMIDHNVTTIARALGGTAPERGLFGKLAAAGE